jgi:signal transduction histidine kinase
MILLYAVLGVFLMSAVLISSHTTPQVIHVNYDSIAASAQMRQSWHALNQPSYFNERTAPEWKALFENALKFEESNITEPGEGRIAQEIRKNWDENRKAPAPFSIQEFRRMDQLLSNLVEINEKGMFGLAQENTSLSRKVLIGGSIYFLLSLILGFVLADGLASRLSSPLKSIAEALHRRPAIGRRMKLIEPNSLELLILNTELGKLWDRVNESEKVNVMELVQQKTKLETVLGSVEDGLLVVDANGTVSHSNECLLEILELPNDQVQGQLWRDLPTNGENFLKLRALLREDMPEASEIDLKLKSAVHQFSARSRKILSPNGGMSSTLFLLHDITEKRQREKFRAEFIDLLSHELKTPLQSLGTASELLEAQKNALPEDIKPLIETIHEDVERIRAVASEFVQVTQSHSKIMKIKLQSIALNQILPEWMKPFRIVAKDRGVKVSFSQEGSEIIWGKLDPVKFPWVISNLLSNAIRFSPVGSEVEVFLTDRNGAVEIQVRDRGPGISEEDQRRIFEPFFQSPTMMTTSGKQGLFGIGLTIAKEVVEAHDGRIEYYPRLPHGSEFRIILPFPSGNYS